MIENSEKTSELIIDADNSNLNTRKWGQAIQGGFVLIPSTVFRYQKELKLDSVEVVVLSNLLSSWWDVPNLPHIQTSTIANRMNVSRRTVQRAISSLEQKGFIKRIWGSKQGVNERAGSTYDLRGTVEILSTRRNFDPLVNPSLGLLESSDKERQ